MVDPNDLYALKNNARLADAATIKQVYSGETAGTSTTNPITDMFIDPVTGKYRQVTMGPGTTAKGAWYYSDTGERVGSSTTPEVMPQIFDSKGKDARNLSKPDLERVERERERAMKPKITKPEPRITEPATLRPKDFPPIKTTG